MFAEAKMNNVNVNHGSWQTTSLLSLLKVELQVANAAFDKYRVLSFLRFEENRAPNALLAFDNLPLKLWSLQLTSIITWNNDEIWGWYVRVCQGRICVGPVKKWYKPLAAGMTWSKTFSSDTALQDSCLSWCHPHSCAHQWDFESQTDFTDEGNLLH